MDKMYVDLFEKERLYYEPVWEAYVARLCKAACAGGDGEGARRWARLAAALNRAYTGEDRGWDAVAAAPERTDCGVPGRGTLEGGLVRGGGGGKPSQGDP